MTSEHVLKLRNCDKCCVACGRPVGETLLVLQRAEGGTVCEECGARECPALATLLDLAEIAMRVGRLSRSRGLWLPLEDLMGMTLAAQKFQAAMPRDGEAS